MGPGSRALTCTKHMDDKGYDYNYLVNPQMRLAGRYVGLLIK